MKATSAVVAGAWSLEEVRAIYLQPLLGLISRAHAVHARKQAINEVQLCHLLSIKTGGCPEDCAYCPQSARHDTGVAAEPLLAHDAVLAAAERAKAAGSTRFCMGAAWRQVREGPEFERVLEMVSSVAGLGLEVCCTLGMLNESQARRLKGAGLTAYNHNLDTSPEFYGNIIQTRVYEDRLRTIEHVRQAGITVCCGGILGLGESQDDRIRMLQTLANLNPPPESVPINALVAVDGTPLAGREPVAAFELARAIATARILMPAAKVRLSAGRLSLSAEAQALCFLAGANSIFVGEKLLTTPNPGWDHDHALLAELGLTAEPPHAAAIGPIETTPARLEADMAEELERRERQSRRRRLRPAAGEDFCSNDYLGLAREPRIAEAVERAVRGGVATGSGASRLVRGNDPRLEALEREFAAFVGAEAALLFSSGFAANAGLLGAVAGAGDVVFSDAANHASLIDGMRLSRARRVVFAHNDLDDLAALVRRHSAGQGRRYVVVESVYSMEGDCAPLARIAELCLEQGLGLIVDEAHALGVLGGEGAGALSEELVPGLRPALVAAVYPCGKALGGSGALVTGSRRLREFLVNTARTLVFSTAPSPLQAAQLSAALELVRTEPQRRERLWTLARQLRTALAQSGARRLAGADQRVPIIPLIYGADAAAVAAADALAALGIDARAIRPPTVPEGTARLRLTVHSFQSPAQVDRLAGLLASSPVTAVS